MSKLQLPEKPGIYTLIIEVAQRVTKEIGKRGGTDFAPGVYTYTGSALGRSANLRVRVGRHLTFEKKKRWHIDYLLDTITVAVNAIIYLETELEKECRVAKTIEQMTETQIPMKGFGSSDCHSGCASHLHSFPHLSLHETVMRVKGVYEHVFRTSPRILYVLEG